MKLSRILDNLNSLEKNAFIKVIDNIIANNPKNGKAVDKLLAESDKAGLKNLDNVIISRIFTLLEEEIYEQIKVEFINTSSQLDILTDIIMRDGNCIMKLDWFSRLYESELKEVERKVKELTKELDSPKSEIYEDRKRDYTIYKKCLDTAYNNDLEHNRDAKVTDDELSVLTTLAKGLDLSQEEVKLINYMILPVKKIDIDTVINNLKVLGIIFHSKKTNTVYTADEMVRLLRRVRNKEIADKFFRRVLRIFREPQINLICKKHNIDKKLSIDLKIKEIIKEGISFTSVLSKDIYKDGTTLSDKKSYMNEIWSKDLKISQPLRGVTLDDKIQNMIAYFEEIEKDDKVGISFDGYEKLLIEINEIIPKVNDLVRTEFEIQDENVLTRRLLLNYNIKPRDILDIIHEEYLKLFCEKKEIKTRGNIVENILNAYKDSENLYLENYINIGFRDIKSMKENGIIIKEADLGLKFEDLTKTIFSQLDFTVDEKLRKNINTNKDKIDILLNIGNNELFLIECKTVKESGYNKFSSVSRQMKSYSKLCEKNGYSIIKSLLIAPDFSDDFINETELECDLNLSLITASSLLKILESFKTSKKHKQFPYKLLMRDVLIEGDRIIKAMGK